MSSVAEHLASRYRRSKAGRTGSAARDLIVVFKDLLAEIDCRHGPERHGAIRELEQLESLGILRMERHRRDPSAILKVRLPREQAEALFAHLGATAPGDERATMAELFQRASDSQVPGKYAHGWKRFCDDMAEAANDGRSIKPFDRTNLAQIRQILAALPAILAWESESYLRFASSVLFGDSKRLEALRPRIESCLKLIADENSTALPDFGIIEHDRSLLIHGPVTLGYAGRDIDLSLLASAARISAPDIRRAQISSPATKCLTVENASMLHELAKRRSGIILASSGSEGGFANSAVIEFLQALPTEIELWHFGDSDPKGFDILRDLRVRSDKIIKSLHMEFRPSVAPQPPLTSDDEKTIDRLLVSGTLTPEETQHLVNMKSAGNKGRFEQEAMGHPHAAWPFF